MLGSVLTFTPPEPNASWAVDFTGPSLNCSHVNRTLYEDVLDNVFTALVYNYNAGIIAPYFSWVPDTDDSSNDSSPRLPLVGPSNISTVRNHSKINKDWIEQSSSTLRSETLGPQSSYCRAPRSEPMALYVALFPGAAVPRPTIWAGLQNSTIVRCQLQNSTYRAAFSLRKWCRIDERNDLVCSRRTCSHLLLEDGVGTSERSSPDSPLLETLSYQSVMDAFGRLLVGQQLRHSAFRPFQAPDSS